MAASFLLSIRLLLVFSLRANMFAFGTTLASAPLTVLRVMCPISSQADCPFVICCIIVLQGLFELAIRWHSLFLLRTTEVCVQGFVSFSICLALAVLFGKGYAAFCAISLWNFILSSHILLCPGPFFLHILLGLGVHS